MNYENLMGRVFQQSDSGKLTSSLVKEVGDLFALQELIESAKQYSYGGNFKQVENN
jgi:hypothetical protein